MRKDISLPQQLVQAAHAAHESGIHLSKQYNNTSSIVICGVSSEKELMKANDYINSKGINTVVFKEPDMGSEATALASEPIDSTKRCHFSKFKLWRQ